MYNDYPFPKYQSVHTTETTKVSDIRDALNNLKYKVAMTSYDVSDDAYGMIYEITVANYFSAPDPLIILTIPERGSGQIITDLHEAEKIYHDCVARYTALVKAETRDFQDIDIYKDSISYKVVTPKCCGTCHWCKQEKTRGDFLFNVTGKMKCTNPENQTAYDFTFGQPIQHPPFYRQGEDQKLVLHPNVDVFGYCPKYETRGRQYQPIPGDSLTRIIDRRIHKMVPTEISSQISGQISSAISAAIDDSVSTLILPEVGKAIEDQLSNHMPFIDGNRDINDYNNDGQIDSDEEFAYNGGGAF